MENTQTQAKTSEFVLSRTFAAPVETVFAAYTEADKLAKWWGPVGLPLEVVKLEVKPGGIFHYSMALPDGNKMWGKFIYREIVAPNKLVFDNCFSDENEGVTRHPMAPTWPAMVHNVMTLEPNADNTATTIKMSGIPITEDAVEIQTFTDGHESMKKGFGSTLDQLEKFLAG